MSLKQIIQESAEKNPLGVKKALQEELLARIALALEAKMSEEIELDEISKKTLGSYIKKSIHDVSDVAADIAYSGGPKGPEYPKLKRIRKNRKQGISRATDRLMKEETGHTIKDGYYVTNVGGNGALTHNKIFTDSKSAISHANTQENKTGRIHRVHKVKAGKIDKQWEFQGGHMDAKWNHFSDFTGDPAHYHIKNAPDHFKN
jgi:hypothetical protein